MLQSAPPHLRHFIVHLENTMWCMDQLHLFIVQLSDKRKVLDSFSKESMSQESEISENILLPDLVKQSESIEQQSGEIAERGMPT